MEKVTKFCVEAPIKPNDEDCCNSGCNPCIFDFYEKQLLLYKKSLESGECVNTSQENGISQLTYTKFIVVKNLALCEFHNLITFRKYNKDNKKVYWTPGDHFLFKYTATDTRCTRAYTPIQVKNDVSEYEDCDFYVIVKKYESGLVSRYLCNLIEGEITLWRGPYGHYKLEPKKYKRIIMIAQGTGIAPFITIINNILKNEDDMTRVVLLYCSKCDLTILFRDELYSFKSYWNFKYNIFLSSAANNLPLRYQEPIKNHKLSVDYLSNFKPFLTNDQFLLCGSPLFNEAYDMYLKIEVPLIKNIVSF